MFQTNVVEEIKTHILHSITFFFFFENCAVCEIMWKNAIDRSRLQMTIWGMRITCWIPKAANIHLQYVILIAFPLQQWLQVRATVLHYIDIACLVPFF